MESNTLYNQIKIHFFKKHLEKFIHDNKIKINQFESIDVHIYMRKYFK